MTAPSGVTRSGSVASHLLAVPASASVQALALAWYPQARWTREPVTAAAATAGLSQPRGARFRGMSAVADAQPGELELEPGVVLTGPHPLEAERCHALGLTAAKVDGYEVRVDGDPVDRGVRLRRWLVAAARHARGAVLEEGSVAPLTLDHRRSVNRHLYSAHALSPEVALALVRTVLVQATLETVGSAAPGPQDYEIVTHTPYDGSVVVRCEHADRLPPALGTVPWRDSGPFRYTVRWLSGDAYPADSEDASNLHHIARRRMAPVVVAVVAVMRTSIAGTVLDDDGFICQDPGQGTG
ncbi:hypothetical protein [Sanguibacter suarezii]|uniref:hypothetical protein n=1 Tax=Sanguibacter suarezii TaxID=60921 RepID=UPI000B211AA9|nr:hypothetical protein [Sanguibacter suarezii]